MEEEIIEICDKLIADFNHFQEMREKDKELNIYQWNSYDDIFKDYKQAIQGLLDLYQKEKETSHFLQSELDYANAKLIEEKEKNKDIINFSESLQEEIKRLKKENKNTIIMTVSLDNNIYKVDTQIENKWNLVENSYYYLANSYKEPSKVKFIEWSGNCSVNNTYLIFCCCNNNGNIEYYHPSSLYKTKLKASEAYLKLKNY